MKNFVKKWKKIFILNWKEYGTIENIESFLSKAHDLELFFQLNYIFCPPMIFLANSIKFLAQNSHTKISVGSQIIDFANGTGRIRGKALASINCSYAMCGHVEKVASDIEKEVLECFENKIKPIVLLQKLEDISLDSDSIVVYEPRASVGTNKSADLAEIVDFVDKAREKYGVPVLYGGSVNAKNAAMIADITDGVCVGRASREFEEVELIAKALAGK